MWINQWPLPVEKLVELESLFQEQIQKWHITPTMPMEHTYLCDPKAWQRQGASLSRYMEDQWCNRGHRHITTWLTVTCNDSQRLEVDCHWLFHIPLQPDDAPQFAFSIPSVSRQASFQWNYWTVLHQGMKKMSNHLSVVCSQSFNACLQRTYENYNLLLHGRHLHCSINWLIPRCYATSYYHSCPTSRAHHCRAKIQQTSPWRYLRFNILSQTIQPQPIQSNNPEMLYDL